LWAIDHQKWSETRLQGSAAHVGMEIEEKDDDMVLDRIVKV
jgi:hypothetical protein